MEALFWISAITIFYHFIGYGVLISVLAKFKKSRPFRETLKDEDLPEVTVLIAAYNEEVIIEEKIQNTLNLDYPKHKLNVMVVSDGSSDQTNKIISRHPSVQLEFKPKRKGKIAAVNRVMPSIQTPITVFTDANVMMNKQALSKLVRHFQSNLVAAVSGEKTVISEKEDTASASGEGFYWKYESYLKKKDAEWNTLVGSAGELFAIRTHLFKPVETSTLIEDFVMTMGFAADGYKVAYEPEALAVETGSASMVDEEKRKVRISAGGIQAVIKLVKLLNVFKYGKLSFQYISHRALRWTLMPLALVGTLFASTYLAPEYWLYDVAFRVQVIFYLLAFAGYSIREGKTKIKVLYIPYYFTFMHICVVKGWIKYFSGKQKVTWEKAERIEFNPKVSSVS